MLRKKSAEERQVMWIIYVIVALLVGGFATCHEAKYAIWGRTADARIIRAQQERFKVGDSAFDKEYVNKYVIHYQWTDEDDGERKDKMVMYEGWQPPPDQIIEIDYLPGVMDSRLAGDRELGGPIMFFGTAGVLVAVFAFLWWKGSKTA